MWKGKIVFRRMATLLLVGMLALTFNIPQAESLEPPLTEWTRTYGGAGWDRALSVVQTFDGGYALGGFTDSFGAGDWDAWLIKTDEDGNMEWNQTYGGPSDDLGLCPVQTLDGGYALLGSTESFGAGGFDFWLIKLGAVTATVDIDPDTLALKSKGKWITVYIQLPEGYDPEDIDATTILLNGTIKPVLDPKYGFVTNPSEYLVDHNEDGILEYMVKFSTAEVKALLSAGEATLTITGEVNGIPFKGSATIKVIDE